MNRIIAVSGGVDSVVLLDILARKLPDVGTGGATGDAAGSPVWTGQHRAPVRLIVAHVEHGIRGEDSAADARFVAGLARSYGLPYIQTELDLGADASEEAARRVRYEFLFAQADKFNAQIFTAHHHDDVIGSIAINLGRGTGWRGLAVHSRAGIQRPLIGWSKQRVYDYALKHHLEWVEDASNQSDKYLRNRLRASLNRLDDATKRSLGILRLRQLQLRHDIDRELARLVQQFDGRRHPYIQIEPRIACELLRHSQSLTHPEAERMLHAIKTGRAGAVYDIAGGVTIQLSRDRFVVAAHLE